MNNIHQEHRRPWGVAPEPQREPRLLLNVESHDRDDHSDRVALSGGLPHELSETWSRRWPGLLTLAIWVALTAMVGGAVWVVVAVLRGTW